MSLLTMIQDITKELGIPTPTTIVNNSDLQIKQLLGFANRTSFDARMRYMWPQLMRENLITLVDGQANYQIPTDFDRFIFRTMWARNYRWELLGPVSPQEWQWRKSGVIASSPRQRFRVKGAGIKEFFIDPTPDATNAGQIMVFEYCSTNAITPVTWTTATNFAANTYCSYDGNFYSTTSGGTTGSTPPTHTSGTISDGGVLWTYTNAIYDRYLADTDFNVLNEWVLGLGIQWRFMQQKGLQYEELKRQYETELQSDASNFKGARTLSMAYKAAPMFISPLNVPDTGFGT